MQADFYMLFRSKADRIRYEHFSSEEEEGPTSEQMSLSDRQQEYAADVSSDSDEEGGQYDARAEIR